MLLLYLVLLSLLLVSRSHAEESIPTLLEDQRKQQELPNITITTTKPGIQYLRKIRSHHETIERRSGVLLRILKHGDGSFHPGKETECVVKYSGQVVEFPNGDAGEPSLRTFLKDEDEQVVLPSQLVTGLTEAFTLMVAGDVWEVTLPSELAYGAEGYDTGVPEQSIPAGAVLVFQVELLQINAAEEEESDLLPKLRCNPHFPHDDHCTDRDHSYLERIEHWSLQRLKHEHAHLTELTRRHHEERKRYSNEHIGWVRRRLHLLAETIHYGGASMLPEPDHDEL